MIKSRIFIFKEGTAATPAPVVGGLVVGEEYNKTVQGQKELYEQAMVLILLQADHRLANAI